MRWLIPWKGEEAGTLSRSKQVPHQAFRSKLRILQFNP
jgi:hypothetical protein